MMSDCVHSWSIVNCEATNCENINGSRMRGHQQYDPITVHFKAETLKEIYVCAATT